MKRPFVCFVMGPTAAGKTDLAIYLQQHLKCQVISVDSGMVYIGMDIGTAKPSHVVQQQVPHRLIDICEVDEAYSADRFVKDAKVAIEESLAVDKIPILVGGTGLYFRALEHGLAKLPAADVNLRQSIEAQAARVGWAVLHQRLAELDPQRAKDIHPHDAQRIQRALEVCQHSAVPMSQSLSQQSQSGLAYPIYKIILAPQHHSLLNDLVARRFMLMLEAGFMNEVKHFYEQDNLHLNLPAMRMIGYRQIWQYLDGLYEQPAMQERAIIATRQLAKRQMTWCRGEQNAQWYDCFQANVFAKILANIQNF